MDYTVPLTSRGESIDIVNDNISLIQNSEFFKFGTALFCRSCRKKCKTQLSFRQNKSYLSGSPDSFWRQLSRRLRHGFCQSAVYESRLRQEMYIC